MLILLLICALTVSADQTQVVQIDPSVTYGTWEGWGTSLCWWANVFGTRDDLSDAFFSLKTNVSLTDCPECPVVPGLGLNIARYNAGGSTRTSIPGGDTMVQSPNMPNWKAMQGFWLNWNSADPSNSTSWNWTVDNTQLTALQKAKERGVNVVELFSNSPMWWMCYNHNPSGSPTGATDNLQNWNYQQHARYLATVAHYGAQVWGIAFSSIELFNEPSSDWWNALGSQEGCHFDASTQAKVLAYLPGELARWGLQPGHDIRIAASDENAVDLALSTWNSFDTATRAVVQQVNVHGYQQGGDREGLYAAVVVQDKKFLRDSEYGDGDGSGVTLLKSVGMDWAFLHPTGWCYWQVIDSAGGWGGLLGDYDVPKVAAVNTKYFVIAHLSRHIRPGMSVVGVASQVHNVIVGYDVSRETLAIVLFNVNVPAADITVVVDLSKFTTVPVGPVEGQWITSVATSTPDPSAAYSRVSTPPSIGPNKTLTVTLASGYVTTVEVTGISR